MKIKYWKEDGDWFVKDLDSYLIGDGETLEEAIGSLIRIFLIHFEGGYKK